MMQNRDAMLLVDTDKKTEIIINHFMTLSASCAFESKKSKIREVKWTNRELDEASVQSKYTQTKPVSAS